jgi:hypothetical protein
MAQPPIDFNSGAWLQIAAWATQQLQDVREKNDAVGLPSSTTDAYRGEIRLLKRLLGLPQAARQSEAVSAKDRPYGDWEPEGS